jgi:hypothetical protein
MAVDQFPRLVAAFPKSETELRLVFSEPMDSRTIEDASAFECRSGLPIHGGWVDPHDPARVTLRTDPMNGEVIQPDVIRVRDARTFSGEGLVEGESPEFIQGIASIPELQRPATNSFPFASRFVGRVASASCGKDGGVDSATLSDTFGFAFIHNEAGGPFNSLKIATRQHIPAVTEATRALRAGTTVHVLWAGGEIRDVDGETQLVDVGYMEGSIIPPNPLRTPPPFPVKVADVAGEQARSLRAKSLQGVVVRFEDVIVDAVGASTSAKGGREITFGDDSGGQLTGVVLANVTTPLSEGQRLASVRALLHQPSGGRYEAIIELDQHLVLSTRQLFGHVILVESYALAEFAGCSALLALRDEPGRTVAVLTSKLRLQTLLETALSTGKLVACWGEQLVDPVPPRGGTWGLDVFGIDGVILYDRI